MVKKKNTIYLASQSPRRKEILRKMKIKFRVIPSNYEEKPQRLTPAKLVLAHAKGKALGAKVAANSGLVIGSDTIVYASGRILGKPKSVREAARMLTRLSGKAHFVYTGVAVRDLKSKKMLSGFAKTKVFVKKLAAEDIKAYIPKVNSLDKAGAYAVQMKPYIVTKTQGSYSNIVGLPEELLRKLLKRFKF
jgi:septum formation protein